MGPVGLEPKIFLFADQWLGHKIFLFKSHVNTCAVLYIYLILGIITQNAFWCEPVNVNINYRNHLHGQTAKKV